MPMTAQDLLQTGRLTLQDPRRAARVVMSWPFSVVELWGVLGLAAIISALVSEALVMQAPEGVDPVLAIMMGSPIAFAAIQFGGLALLVTLTYGVGRQFGGKGSFVGALALMGWLQTILVVLQVAQIVALTLLPPLAVIISLMSLVLFVWLMTSFTAELHGFTSLVKTFFGMVAAFFGMSVLLALFLVLVMGLGA